MKNAVAFALGAVCILGLGCARDPQKLRDGYLASGDEYRNQKLLREAVIEYRNAVQQDPRSADARLRLAETLAQTGDIRAATREQVRAADLRPDDVEVQVNAGAFLLLAGSAEDAKDRAERALRLDPAHVRGHLLMSAVLAALKDFGAAVAALDTAIKLDPQRAGTFATLGALQMQRGETEKAESALRRATELDPSSVAVRLALARFYWLVSRHEEAEAEFKVAVQVDATRTVANQAIAAFYIATRRFHEAEPFLRAVVDLTGSSEARFVLAEYYASTSQRDKAVQLLDALATNKATFAKAALRLAALDQADGRSSDAHRRVDAVLEREPTNFTALVMSADLLLREKKVDDALARATQAARSDSRDPRVHVLLGRIHAARYDTPKAIGALMEALTLRPRDAFVLRELGRLYLASGDIDAALRFSQEAVTVAGSDLETRLLLARVLMARREFERAGEELRKLEAVHAGIAAVHVQGAILKALTSKPREARAGFERALAIEAGNAEALNGLTMLDLSAGDFQSATTRAEVWLKAHPETPVGLFAGARAYAGAGDHATAERLLRRVLEIEPSNLAAYGTLAQLYVSQKKLDQARAEFDALAAKAPRPAAALTMAGTILQMQDRSADARQRYERALNADPKAAVAANNLAWMHAESGENLDRALQLAQTAVSEMPDAAEALDTLGWVYYKKQLGGLAIPLFSRCVEKVPANPTYHYHLGLAYMQAGDSARGRASLERALATGADAVSASEIKRLLAARSPSNDGRR